MNFLLIDHRKQLYISYTYMKPRTIRSNVPEWRAQLAVKFDHSITKWIGQYRAPRPKIYSICGDWTSEGGCKVNKNLYEITGLVGESLGPISLRLRHLRSRYLPVPPSLHRPTFRRVLYSTHREDSHYREQSRRIVRGRAGARQIVTYFTFFPKGLADLFPLRWFSFGQMMHAEERWCTRRSAS